ncbi:MAG: MerR family transcriptional regulator [Acidimicrobiales bacterium]|nr:MerR family transcriptional regulator [Acidimicrobiales bacterium]
MTERQYLSIGEVLALLQEEFPDVTISKIRFLESQGLIDPERTPSGYRKFYDNDIERLRWILREQKENFLPLRVIKDRLAAVGPHGVPAPVEPPAAEGVLALDVDEVAVEGGGADATTGAATATGAAADPLDTGASAASFTLEELATASGLGLDAVTELEQYGLVTGRAVGRVTYYDEEALIVARLAAGFLRYGAEARHLRMYRNAADREAGLFEQVVLPMLKQRNPVARRHAREALVDLARLGEGLRAAMLRAALRQLTEGS